MALGYEGYVMLDGKYVLGTGTAVPRTSVRIDSSSGYVGTIIGGASMGIGAPRTYDWKANDGSLDFEMTEEVWSLVLKPWLAIRQTSKAVYFSSRDGNEQEYDAYWSSISASASEQSAVTGSVGFTAIDRKNYDFGVTGKEGYINNVMGQGLLCPVATFPKQLNAAPPNVSPIPWWNTKVNLGSSLDFVNWNLEMSQDVVKFFACLASSNPDEPAYLAVGPMTVVFSGAYMFSGATADVVASGTLTLGSQVLTMTQMELQSVSDDVQTADSTVPLTVEYAVYGIS